MVARFLPSGLCRSPAGRGSRDLPGGLSVLPVSLKVLCLVFPVQVS